MLYILKAESATEDFLTNALTVYALDYNTMHCRFGHASKDALHHARKHVHGFPNIEFPTQDSICPGCTLGKLPNKSFPPTEHYATHSFELIHSDLKQFPIDSYTKKQYTIIFVDDYSVYY